MYIDESGGADEVVTSEEITVTVDGQDYEVDLAVDATGDGHNDTAVVHNVDGTVSGYTDSTGDGHADSYIELNSDGELLAEARYDDVTGQWVAADPSASAPDPGAEQQTGAGEPMTAEMPSGETIEVGPPTVDTNGDGTADTAIAEDDAGNTYAFTDADGDGNADLLVVIAPDGSSQSFEHTGGGDWSEIDMNSSPMSSVVPEASSFSRAVAESVAQISGWGSLSGDSVEGVAKIDPSTGQWITYN